MCKQVHECVPDVQESLVRAQLFKHIKAELPSSEYRAEGHEIPCTHSTLPHKNKFLAREAVRLLVSMLAVFPIIIVQSISRVVLNPVLYFSRPVRSRGKTVLVTSAKRSKAYYMCRSLSLRGYRVIAVEYGESFCLCSWSRHVDKYLQVPDPAKSGQEAYLQAMKRIMHEEGASLIVPGVGHSEPRPLARLFDELPSKVFFCASKLVDQLDDKHEFFKLAREYDLPSVQVPHTTRVSTQNELRAVLNELEGNEDPASEFFIKREGDSSNRDRDTRRGTAAQLQAFKLLENETYVLQPFIEGTEYCANFSVSHGVITGLCVANGEPVNLNYYNAPTGVSKMLCQWLEPFLAGINYNGFGSIDFIHRETDDKIFVLEFNPRLHTCCVLFNDAPVWDPNNATFFQPPADNLACYWLTNELLKTFMARQPASLLLHRLKKEKSVLGLDDDPFVELANFVQYSAVVVTTFMKKGLVDVLVCGHGCFQ